MNHHIGEKAPVHIQGVHRSMMARGEINERLLREILTLFPSVQACAKAFEVEYTTLLDLINMTHSPLRHDYEWREISETVAHGLGFSLIDLFPPELYPPPKGEMSVNAGESPRVLHAGRRLARIAIDERVDVTKEIDQRLMNSLLREVMLRCLSFREREILAMRFGFDMSSHCTLEEVGRVFRISDSRVRVIEMNALAKLKKRCSSEFGVRTRTLYKYWRQLDETPFGPPVPTLKELELDDKPADAHDPPPS